MIRSFLKITGEFPKPRGMGRRIWSDIKKNAHAEIAAYWHKHFLRKHFQPSARSLYGYRNRSRKYLRRKEFLANHGRAFLAAPIQMGGKVDLVFTGAMSRQLIANNTIKAYPTRATLIMTGPRYVTMRVWRMNQPDKAAEITAMREEEITVLMEVMDKSIQKGINQSSRG